MSEFTGLTDDEKDRLRDWWDEETTVSVESVFPEVARIVIARVIAAEQAGREDNALHDMCYVSGSKALEAREAAAGRKALEQVDHWKRVAGHVREQAEEQQERADAAEAKVARVKALALPDGIWKGDKHVRLTRRDRSLGCDITESYVRVDDLTAALAEPAPDGAPCSCGSRDATSLTPGERLHHSPDGCTIERGGEDGR